jgi:hypothetical protein
MTLAADFPEFAPDVTLKVGFASGSMTLNTGSKLENYASYDMTAPDVKGTCYKNGVCATSLTINATTGAITMSAVTVTAGDHIEFRFRRYGRLSLPWYSRFAATRTLYLDAPSGTTTINFDATTNVMPVPAFTLGFGWSGTAFKAGVKVTSSDSATQTMTLNTKLYGTCPTLLKSTAIDLSSTAGQSQTATLAKIDVDRDVEVQLVLANGTGTTKVEDNIRLDFESKEDIPAWPTGFPDSGLQIGQTKVGGSAKWTKL